MATELNGWYGEMAFPEVCEKVRDLCQYEIDMEREHDLPVSGTWTRHQAQAGEAERIYLAAMEKAERRIQRIRERAARVAARTMRKYGLGEFATAIEAGDYSDIVF